MFIRKLAIWTKFSYSQTYMYQLEKVRKKYNVSRDFIIRNLAQIKNKFNRIP